MVLNTDQEVAESVRQGQETVSLDIWAELELGSAHILGGGYSKVLRRVESIQELKRIAAKIAFIETTVTPAFLDSLGLPQLNTPSFWVTEVLPAIRKEIGRRSMPVKSWDSNSPIARIKANHRIEDVAARFTDLRSVGSGKFKGRCPLHEERTASFYVYADSGRWWCIGACARGGDVVDLIQGLRRRENTE